jgi:hypothetical protein
MARDDVSTLALGALLALALLPAFWPSDAMAQDCADEATDLIAGRTMNVGDVNVCNDDTILTVTYEATGPWCLLKTDLHVATSENGIPQTNRGNPKSDEFAYGDEHDCVGTATFEILLDEIGEDGVEPGDTVVIAAHAEVEDDTGRVEGAWGEGPRFVERGNWAMYFTYVVQAPPPSTSCVCDGFTATGGTTGAEMLRSYARAGSWRRGRSSLRLAARSSSSGCR